MFTVKLLGACMLALAGWCAGAAICTRVSAHRIALEEVIALLKSLEEEISFRRANLNALYARYAGQNAFPSLGFSRDAEGGQVEANATAQALFSTLRPPPCLTQAERKAFTACFARLGHTVASQECEQLARYRKQFEGFLQAAQKAEREARALDCKIGFALGSMVALTLL